jgi:hypothetical protein
VRGRFVRSALPLLTHRKCAAVRFSICLARAHPRSFLPGVQRAARYEIFAIYAQASHILAHSSLGLSALLGTSFSRLLRARLAKRQIEILRSADENQCEGVGRWNRLE